MSIWDEGGMGSLIYNKVVCTLIMNHCQTYNSSTLTGHLYITVIFFLFLMCCCYLKMLKNVLEGEYPIHEILK